MIGYGNLMNISTGLVGAMGSYQKGQAEAWALRRERKGLETETDLALRKKSKERRQAVGERISRSAGSGVDLNLEDIARMEEDYLLDEAIIKNKGELEADDLKRAERTQKRMGTYGMLPGLSGAGSGLLKTGPGKKLGDKFKATGLGKWLQT